MDEWMEINTLCVALLSLKILYTVQYLQYVYVLYREALLPERGVRSGERDEGRAVGHVSIA